MAAWLSGIYFLLLSMTRSGAELPCEGYELLEGFGLSVVGEPDTLGGKTLEVKDVASDQECWEQCCKATDCDLAVFAESKCRLVRCNVLEFNVCNLTAQENTTSYRKLDSGVPPNQADFCIPKGETGPCRAYFNRWYYDAETENCKNFTFGGCPMNLNNHVGEQECMEKCRGVKAIPAETQGTPERLVADAPLPEMCSGPSVTGNCRASFQRWFFDSESKACRTFIFGGCGGSKNNHLSEAECIDKCVVQKPEPVKSPKLGNFKEYCAAAPLTGKCRASFSRFYYDPSAMTCKKFVYGGCKPNNNNYITEDDCLKMCSGRSEEDDNAVDHHIIHHPLTAVVLPILLAMMAASLLGVMIVFFIKMTKKNQHNANFRAMWNPIDDKECLMNSAYTL